MKLDQHTIKVLSNFSNINNSIVVKEGNELRTMPDSKTILAEANVADSFPVDFAIADLRKFLGCMSIYQTPEIEFNDDNLVIHSGSNSIRMYYCNPDLITYPTKRLNLPSADINFKLSEENLAHLIKTSNILSCDDILITGQGGTVIVSALDSANPTTDSSSMTIPGDYSKEDFKVYLKISNLKVIAGEYNVAISEKGISLFQHTAKDLKYYIAVEAKSSF